MLDLTRMQAQHKVVRCNPLVAHCPRCGALTARHETRVRRFWKADLHLPTVLEVHVGCYTCRGCPRGAAWFCELPPECRTAAQYTVSTVRLVVGLMKVRKMSAEGAAAFAREELHLEKLDPSMVME